MGGSIRQFFLLLIVVLAVRSLVFEPFNIPSGSMIPTLQIGDFVLVSKSSYGYSRFSFPLSLRLFSGRLFGSEPHRGDVAVFRFTQDNSIDYIKRIVGLPGDHVRMMNGRLLINNIDVPRRRLGHYQVRDESGRLLSGDRYREKIPGSEKRDPVEHDVLKLTDEGVANNTPDYVVPAGCFFAMGDDRDDSSDSRFQGGRRSGSCAAPPGVDFPEDGEQNLGYVPMENLVGRAVIVLFSIDLRHPGWEFWYWPSEIRWGRFLHRIS